MSYQDHLNDVKVIRTVETAGDVPINGTKPNHFVNPNIRRYPTGIAEQERECEKLGAAIITRHGIDDHGSRDVGRLQAVVDTSGEPSADVDVRNTCNSQDTLRDRIAITATVHDPEMASVEVGSFPRSQSISTRCTCQNTATLVERPASRIDGPRSHRVTPVTTRDIHGAD